MAVVSFEKGTSKAKPPTKRAVRGKEGEPKKGEPGYNPTFVDVPAVPAYEYDIAKVVFKDGDETGENTFIEVFETLAKGNYRNAVKYLTKGFNYFSKKTSAPKSDAKQLKALRTLAEATGKSLEEIKASLGL